MIILSIATNAFFYFLYQLFPLPTWIWLAVIASVFVVGFKKLIGPGFSPTMSEGFPTIEGIKLDHKNSNYKDVDGPSSIFGFLMMLAAFLSLYFCLAVT